MELTRLIQHPEGLNRETLYDLRSLLALHPYYQTARLLMLLNLYLLHDTDFNEELKRAAIYLTDRKVLFQMIEIPHYQLKEQHAKHKVQHASGDRTVDLIDNFLETLPPEETEEEKKEKKRKPTPADAAIDYVRYLQETELEQTESNVSLSNGGKIEVQQRETSRTIDLIDNFIEDGGFQLPKLKEQSEDTIPIETSVNLNDIEPTDATNNGGVFTETLARIYIKQAKYEKALDTIENLCTHHPQKSAYYTDQMRFLEKLIKNNNNK